MVWNSNGESQQVAEKLPGAVILRSPALRDHESTPQGGYDMSRLSHGEVPVPEKRLSAADLVAVEAYE